MKDDTLAFLSVLPPSIVREIYSSRQDVDDIVEVTLDLYRPAEVRCLEHSLIFNETTISPEDLAWTTARCQEFNERNRAGIDGTLHRISRILDSTGNVVGLTCRVGRPIPGCVAPVQDHISSGESVLFLGAPGVGKTTRLRDCARFLAQDRRVVIVDSSNEIGGGGTQPHPAVGRARRMPIPPNRSQVGIMIEAVENHTPEVIVIDEISTKEEAMAARTIAQRGVQLIASAHGRCLEDILANPFLNDLVGGIETVTLSDDAANARGTRKTSTERRWKPTFGRIIEIVDFDIMRSYDDVEAAVDALLYGSKTHPEERRVLEGRVVITQPQRIDTPAYTVKTVVTPVKEEPKRQRR